MNVKLFLRYSSVYVVVVQKDVVCSVTEQNRTLIVSLCLLEVK